jgi:hypothetical protein
MHYALVVALPGSITDEDVQYALDAEMDRYSEYNEDAVSGEWDWYVVGGRWGSEWTLRPGAPNGPLATEPSTFGYREERMERNGRATDCARWQHLMPESVSVPYCWLDLDGRWYSMWLGPELSGSQDVKDWERGPEHGEGFMKFLATLPPDTWLVNVDIHG